MSASFPTLPTSPLPYPAMDYAALRAEGLELLGRLTGGQWTDFNAHDPGITILEQLCYAITDLGYRASFPMADLLAHSPDLGLPGPHQILTCDPVTATDLRKVVADLGVGAVALAAPDELPIYHHSSSGELRLVADPGMPDQGPIQLRGLHRLLVQTTDSLSGSTAMAAVGRRVHRGRLAGEDLEIGLLGTFEVWIGAALEIRTTDDPIALMADIIEAIGTYLAPPTRFYSRDELPELGYDALYEGPLLDHGFVLELPTLREAVYTSDLLHVILDVPGVRAVRSIGLSTSSTGVREAWALQIPAGSVARLANDSSISLLRAGLPVRVDREALNERLEQRRLARDAALTAQAPPTPPQGRRRELARTRSVQRQLPAAYGVGTLGLPSAASAERQAQALQLQAYLLIFDQLLANGLAQLANAHALLSPDDGGTRSYFAQPVEDPPLDLAALVRMNPAAFSAWLDATIEPGDPLERRQRFLAHLLARFSEELGDHARIGADAIDAPDAEIVAERQAFLRDIARLTGARGSGYNLLTGEDGGLEARLRVKLGDAPARRFVLIEHILLRPVPEDRAQIVDEGEEQIPLLAGVASADPYSLQLSVVFQDQADSEDFRNFEQFVAQTLLAETPAHLRPTLRWFGAADGVDHWSMLYAAGAELRERLAAYRADRLNDSDSGQTTQLRFRDARDRVIDLLGLGRTWPLRDIPLSERLIVAPGAAAEITLDYSQRGVRYELRREDNGAQVLIDGAPIAAEGTDGALTLPTPPIDVDVSYRVLAIKLDGLDDPELRRQVLLSGTIRVEEGVDPRLVAQIRLPLLNASADSAKPTDARIADYGVAVEVELLESQEGVVYTLIDDAEADKVDATPLSASVVGTSGTVVLTYPQTTEDLDLRVRGSKAVGDPQNPELRTATLDIVLPLRVRAKRSAEAALTAPIVEHNGASTLELRTTQRTVSYQPWERAVRDSELVFEDPPSVAVVEVSDGDRTIRVQRPTDATELAAEGYAACGDAKTGNGQKISFSMSNFVRDTHLLVLATKQHSVGPLRGEASGTLPSTVQLSRAVVQLVRPDPDVALRVQVRIEGANTVGDWRFLDGQPGVFYAVQDQDKTMDVPAYFHQRDDVDARQNKGVNQLRLQVDFALAKDAPIEDKPALQAPPPPELALSPVAVDSRFTVLARRAMTGLERALNGALVLAAPVDVRAEPDKVEAGQSAKIQVASVVGERYGLSRDGQAVGEMQAGSGDTLGFDTGALDATTTFELMMIRDGAITVERRVQVVVQV